LIANGAFWPLAEIKNAKKENKVSIFFILSIRPKNLRSDAKIRKNGKVCIELCLNRFYL
jgi:hypothetical protein